LSASPANPENRRQSDFRVFVIGNVYPSNTGHPITPES
jgi:hypothetical protein